MDFYSLFCHTNIRIEDRGIRIKKHFEEELSNFYNQAEKLVQQKKMIIFKLNKKYLKFIPFPYHWLISRIMGSTTICRLLPSDPFPNLTNVFAFTVSSSQLVITRNVPTMLE